MNFNVKTTGVKLLLTALTHVSEYTFIIFEAQLLHSESQGEYDFINLISIVLNCVETCVETNFK